MEGLLTPMKKAEIDRQQSILNDLNKEYNQKRDVIEANEIQISLFNEELEELLSKQQNLRLREQELNVAIPNEAQIIEQRETESKLLERVEAHERYNSTLNLMINRLNLSTAKLDKRIDLEAKCFEALHKSLNAQKIKFVETQNLEKVAIVDVDKQKKSGKFEIEEWINRLQANRDLVAETNDIWKFREKQAETQAAIIAEVKGDLDSEGEQKLQRKVVANRMKQLRIANDIAKNSEKIDDYERAFKRIVEATGITAMNQVVERFLSQEDTTLNLNLMIEEGNAKVSALTETLLDSKKVAGQVRFTGVSHVSHKRKLIDEKEVKIDHFTKTNKSLRERTSFLQSVVRGIKATIYNINILLDEANIPNPASAKVDSTTEDDPQGDPQSDDEVVKLIPKPASNKQIEYQPEWFSEALNSCQQRLLKLVDSFPPSSKNITIDEVEPHLLASYGRNKVVVRPRKFSKPVSNAKTVKNKVKKLITEKGGIDKLIGSKKKNRRDVAAEILVKRKQEINANLRRCEVNVNDSKCLMEDAIKDQETLKKQTNPSADIIAMNESKLMRYRSEYDRALSLLDEKKSEMRRLVHEFEAVILVESESENDSDSDEGGQGDLDDYERTIPLLGASEGRKIIKEDTKRILKLAERKRFKLTRGTETSHENMDIEVIKATKLEAKKISAIRSQFPNRLSYVKNKKQGGVTFNASSKMVADQDSFDFIDRKLSSAIIENPTTLGSSKHISTLQHH